MVREWIDRKREKLDKKREESEKTMNEGEEWLSMKSSEEKKCTSLIYGTLNLIILRMNTLTIMI